MALKQSNKSRRKERDLCRQKIAEIEAKSLTDQQLSNIIAGVCVLLVLVALL